MQTVDGGKDYSQISNPRVQFKNLVGDVSGLESLELLPMLGVGSVFIVSFTRSADCCSSTVKQSGRSDLMWQGRR
jgi:hypothetical protein